MKRPMSGAEIVALERRHALIAMEVVVQHGRERHVAQHLADRLRSRRRDEIVFVFGDFFGDLDRVVADGAKGGGQAQRNRTWERQG